jgi:hypothetical protein
LNSSYHHRDAGNSPDIRAFYKMLSEFQSGSGYNGFVSKRRRMRGCARSVVVGQNAMGDAGEHNEPHYSSRL